MKKAMILFSGLAQFNFLILCLLQAQHSPNLFSILMVILFSASLYVHYDLLRKPVL